MSQGERRFYPSFLFGEGSWDAGGRFRARLRAGYDFQDEFVLVEPEVSVRVWRELRVGLVAHLIHDEGSRGFDYFDLIRHEDRIGLRTQYFFCGGPGDRSTNRRATIHRLRLRNSA